MHRWQTLVHSIQVLILKGLGLEETSWREDLYRELHMDSFTDPRNRVGRSAGTSLLLQIPGNDKVELSGLLAKQRRYKNTSSL